MSSRSRNVAGLVLEQHAADHPAAKRLTGSACLLKQTLRTGELIGRAVLGRPKHRAVIRATAGETELTSARVQHSGFRGRPFVALEGVTASHAGWRIACEASVATPDVFDRAVIAMWRRQSKLTDHVGKTFHCRLGRTFSAPACCAHDHNDEDCLHHLRIVPGLERG